MQAQGNPLRRTHSRESSRQQWLSKVRHSRGGSTELTGSRRPAKHRRRKNNRNTLLLGSATRAPRSNTHDGSGMCGSGSTRPPQAALLPGSSLLAEEAGDLMGVQGANGRLHRLLWWRNVQGRRLAG